MMVLLASYAEHSWAGEPFIALCYHDIQDDIPANAQAITIRTDELVAQFSWLKAHGYRPVSLDDLIAARDGRRPLPDKAVLLTFDDGYRSVYTRVFPLLKLYHFPAVIALVSDWMELKSGDDIHYDDNRFAREQLITWEQAREMERSGLVEIASHSHRMHVGVPANPQGNEQPAAVSRIYDTATRHYEDDAHYLSRVKDDLQRSVQQIERHLGHKPRALVWPYGAYSQPAVETARDLGMTITLNLADGRGDAAHLQSIPRYLIRPGTSLSDFVWLLRNKGTPQPLRVAHVDLDYVYDADPAQQEKNLGLLVERIKQMEINTVFLQAFADPDGEGAAAALYFPNRHLPVRADLFNRAAHQLRTRASVKVYAWLPVLAYKLPDGDPAAHLTVRHDGAQHNAPEQQEHRLSPFYPETRKLIAEIYEDLAKHADFSGILFHDDAYLTDSEDSSPAALSYYRQNWGLPDTIAGIRATPGTLAAWSARKTRFLIDFTDELAARVRYYRPDIKTARNLYAQVIMDPGAESKFAQSLPAFVEHYDYTAVMAMPYLEGAAKPRQWLAGLAERIAATPGTAPRTVFELQGTDWNKKAPLASAEMAAEMSLLRRKGIANFGYYPEDFANAHPALDAVKPEISLRANPYR